MGGQEVLLVILVLAYLLPTIIAASRHHHNAGAIVVLNLLAGWTPSASGSSIPSDAAAMPSIRAKCAKEWPDDFRMRLYCENEQLGALRKLRAR